MHPSMERLYELVREFDEPIESQKALADALNESPQRVSNWEARGLSKEGALAVQAKFSLNATYLLNGGSGPKTLTGKMSQPGRLDGAILRNAITLVKSALLANNVSRFDVVEDADEVAQAVNFIVARGINTVTADNVLAFMQSRASDRNVSTDGNGSIGGNVGPQSASAPQGQSRAATRKRRNAS